MTDADMSCAEFYLRKQLRYKLFHNYSKNVNHQHHHHYHHYHQQQLKQFYFTHFARVIILTTINHNM